MKKLLLNLLLIFFILLQYSEVFWKEKCEYIQSNYYNYISEAKYSPNWNGFVFIAEDSIWKNYIVKNWLESKKYDYIYDLDYSPDWSEISYIAYENWTEFLIKDWTEIKNYTNINQFLYSPDSKSYVYIAQE